MKYRHSGKAGIQVSELSFVSWPIFHTQAAINSTVEMMGAALKPVADQVGATRPQFSLAGCLQNERAGNGVTGASRVRQLYDNLRALKFVDSFTPELMLEIDRIVEGA